VDVFCGMRIYKVFLKLNKVTIHKGSKKMLPFVVFCDKYFRGILENVEGIWIIS